MSKTTLITASHCLNPSATAGGLRMVTASRVADADTVAAFASGAIPTKVFYSGPTSATKGASKGGNMDLAVLVFGRDVAPGVVSLLGRKIDNGEEIISVGFGMRQIDEKTETAPNPVKRYGSNKAIVDSTRACQGLYAVGRSANGSPTTVQSDVLSGSGDSGGPVLVSGKLAAVVASSGEFTDRPSQASAYYVTLDSTFALDFLKVAKKRRR